MIPRFQKIPIKIKIQNIETVVSFLELVSVLDKNILQIQVYNTKHN